MDGRMDEIETTWCFLYNTLTWLV